MRISYHLGLYLVWHLSEVHQIVHKNFRLLSMLVLDFSLDGGARGWEVFPFITGVTEVVVDY